jgi:hypothetical protein
MPYVGPQMVTAGVDKVVDILHDGGEGEHSVAIVRKGREMFVARRWNGTEEKPAGFPNSRGHATWDFLSREEGIVISAHYMAGMKNTPAFYEFT